MNHNSKIIVIIFFWLFSAMYLNTKFLTYGHDLDGSVRLKLVKIENETENQDFSIFYGFDSSSGFVAAKNTFNFDASKEIGLSSANILTIKCCKGSYVPVFMQDGGCAASGSVDEGFQGPFFIAMWLGMPNAAEANKIRIRYQVKKGSIGKIGVRIGSNGDYRLVAYENVKFLEH